MLLTWGLCVNKKAPVTNIVYWGLNRTSKTSTPSFLPSLLLILQTIRAALPHFFSQFNSNILLFHAPP